MPSNPSQPMKDLSFFLLKNSLGAKMKKGYRSFCNDDSSTSILNQRKYDGDDSCMAPQSLAGEIPPTLEEMILQLELEEKMARAAKLEDHHHQYAETRRRMSCVNNSDILRSARNALNQYPRFSLDGKDAMYRSSFRNMPPISNCNHHGLKKGLRKGVFNSESEKTPFFPAMIAGESVVWCKPGVVAKLMGLEAMPVPVGTNRRREKSNSVMKKQMNLRKRDEKHEMERRKQFMGSCSTTGYCVMKPIRVEPANDGPGWPIRHFL